MSLNTYPTSSDPTTNISDHTGQVRIHNGPVRIHTGQVRTLPALCPLTTNPGPESLHQKGGTLYYHTLYSKKINQVLEQCWGRGWDLPVERAGSISPPPSSYYWNGVSRDGIYSTGGTVLLVVLRTLQVPLLRSGAEKMTHAQLWLKALNKKYSPHIWELPGTGWIK